LTIANEFQNKIDAETDPERQNQLLISGTKYKTWNRHLSVFNALFPWAASNGLVAHGTPSPFRKLFVWVDEDLDPSKGGSEKRKMWLERQLAKLLSSPLFTGFRSPSRLWMPGDMMVQDALYWVILIVAHSGMRREEPCQLLVKHVVQDEETGIWYFDLKARGLVLKEPASKRWVVLHNNLLQLGFIEKQVLGRDPNEQLFPELYRSSTDDKFGDKLGQSFLEYRRAHDAYCLELDNPESPFIPLYEHLRDLHSFCTTVCTMLIRAGVPQAHAEEFTGHKSEARQTAFANYDKGATLKNLKQAINKLVLPIDISVLLQAANKQ
jgi:integrase